MEYSGPGVKTLSMADRFVCNMAIEAGGKNGIFPVDDITLNISSGSLQNAMKQEILPFMRQTKTQSTMKFMKSIQRDTLMVVFPLARKR